MQISKPRRRASALLTALFFIALTAVGLFTSADYGQPWDEPWEQDILRMNGNQYASALGLGQRLQLQSNMPAPDSGLIADSIERDHGECAYYPLLPLLAAKDVSPRSLMILWHGYTWLWFMAGAAALWLVCRRLGLSRVLSAAAVMLLVLTPRMFAEGHYNNKDLVLLTLVLWTLWLALRLMENPTFGRAVLFSLAGAAATNTKIIGLPVWGLCALAVLARQIAGRRMTARVWRVALVTALAFGGFYCLLTPALWSDPLGYLQYAALNAAGFTRWENSLLFRGAVFDLTRDVLPRYYLPYMILVTTPLWILPLIAIGQCCAVGRLCKLRGALFADETALALLLCTLLWLAPFLYAVIGHPVMYNGWRHFYFLYGPMLALAGYGLQSVMAWLRRRKTAALKQIGAAALSLCMAVTGGQTILSHPNQFTYYNALVNGRNLPEYLELDYWNVSVLQTLRSLLATVAPAETVTVTGAELWSQYGLEAALPLLDPAEQARVRLLPQKSDVTAGYVLSNRTYAVLGRWQPPQGATVVAETDSYGWPLCTIYRLP